MPVIRYLQCCLCEVSTPAEPMNELTMNWTDPDGWAQVSIGLQEQVINPQLEGMVDAMMTTNAQLGSAMAHSYSMPFHTSVVVCPECQQGAMWEIVRTRLKKATEMDSDQPSANLIRFAPPQAVDLGEETSPEEVDPPPAE